MTRKQAYTRLALIGFVLFALISIAGRDPAVGAVMAGVVFATGLLAVELGLGRRQRSLDRRDDE